MVRRVLLASSLLATIGLPVCTGRRVIIPAVYKDANAVNLHHSEGFLYEDGKPFSGYVYELFANGDTATLTPYAKGKEEGWQRKWFAKDRLMEERFYSTGKKEGIHKGWWPNGKPKFSYHFASDDYEGEVSEWDEAGLLYKKMHYQAGHETGLQQLWWPDGKLRANYVVKNGRAYGLIGRKLCVNNDAAK